MQQKFYDLIVTETNFQEFEELYHPFFGVLGLLCVLF